MTLHASSPEEGNGHGSACHVHLVAAGPHELVPGGVPVTGARLSGLDPEARQWIGQHVPRYAVFAVPAAGEDAQDVGGSPARPTRTVVVSNEAYRALLGLRPA